MQVLKQFLRDDLLFGWLLDLLRNAGVETHPHRTQISELILLDLLRNAGVETLSAMDLNITMSFRPVKKCRCWNH